MYILIEVGGYLGALPTIGLVMVTAVIGVALLRVQGLATLTRGVGRLNRGELPAVEMVEGLLLGIAAALLLTPGFVTDAVGFTLLVPPSRQWLVLRLMSRVQVVATPFGGAPGPGPGSGPGPGQGGPGRPSVLEGEFEPLDGDAPPGPGSGSRRDEP